MVGCNATGGPGLLTAKRLIDSAQLNELGFLQFGDNLPLHTLNQKELIELKNYAAGAGVQLEVGTRGLNRQNIEQYLQIARQLGSGFIRLVIDDDGFHPDVNEVIDIIGSALPLLSGECIVLAIENHDRFKARTLEYIIRSTDPNWVGICLDTANSIGAGEGIREVGEILAPYTVNVHIKDFEIKRVSHKMGFTVEGKPSGDGMLDISWLIGELEKWGRCNTATLELWIEPALTVELTLAKEKQWVDKSLQYLKTIIK